MGLLKNKIQDIRYGNVATTVVRIAMGLLLIYSGIFKIIEPAAFARTIDLYRLLPVILIPYVAIILPSLELIIGLMIAAGFRIRAASLLAMVMMTVFIIAISINVAQGNVFQCGCFELERLGISEAVGPGLIVRDAVFLMMYLFIFSARRHTHSLDTVLEKMRLNNP